MFDDQTLEKYADILTWGMELARSKKKGAFARGDIVRLFFTRLSYPLAEVVYRKCIQKGYHVVTQLMLTPNMEKDFFNYASDAQLDFIQPWAIMKTNNLNGNIVIYGSEQLTNLKDVDPKRIARNQKPLMQIKDILDKREMAGKYNWCLGLWPTQDMADQAGISLDKMFEQVKKACFLDLDDPVSKWSELYNNGQKITKMLKSLEIDNLRILSDNCDLTIKLGKFRKFLSISGHNIPSFEIFTSPDKYGTEGYYYADQPTFRNGNYVEGAYLKFSKGKIIEAKAAKGEKFLKSQLQIDEGATYLGEFSLTDKRHSRIDTFMANTLYDENTGGNGYGNCHIAIGSSYPNTFDGKEKWEEAIKLYNFNKSALHWDLVNIEPKIITAKLKGGREIVVYNNGMFTIDD